MRLLETGQGIARLRWIGALALVVALSASGCAGTTRPIYVPIPEPGSDWTIVTALRSETLLRLEDRAGTWVSGELEAADQRGLRLRVGGDVVDVPRTSVKRIFLLGRRQIARGALWGLLLGAVVPVAAIAIANDWEDAEWLQLLVPFYGGVGAGIGAALGTGFREQTLLYEAPTAEPSEVGSTSPRQCAGARCRPVG